MVEVKFIQTHPRAKLPSQAHPEIGTGDSGFDLYAVIDGDSCLVVPKRGSVVVPVGLKLAYVTPGYWFRIEARSGLGFKYGVQPHFGIIDNSFRGSLGVKVYNLTDVDYTITDGDRIAQIIFYPLIQPVVSFTDTAVETNRGETGFGNSGR